MSNSTEVSTKPQAEMTRRNRCNAHRDCRIEWDGLRCPMCELWAEIDSYRGTVDRLRKRVKDRDEEIERCRTRIFVLDIDVGNLKDWLLEAEKERDQLQTRLDDLEDPPIKKPQPPEDMGAWRDTEVKARAWREGAGL